MCGVTGAIIKQRSDKYWDLLRASEIRGQDGTGVTILTKNNPFWNLRSNLKASEANLKVNLYNNAIIIGQNRLAIFGLEHNNDQPLVTDNLALVHNGNLFNFEEVFKKENLERKYQVDTELILRLYERDGHLENIFRLNGNFACLLIDKERKLLLAFVKNKPLCYTEDDTGKYFFSTERIGKKVFNSKIIQLKNYQVICQTLKN